MARLIDIITVIGIALMCVVAEETYSDQYDDIKVDEILANDKLRDQYYGCFMDTEQCVTADAKFFKEIFSEAIVTKCNKCTEKQKENMDMIVDWYTKNQPEQWQALIEKAVQDVKQKKK